MKRFPYANIYEKGRNKFQAVLGGVPNVAVDVAGNLKPMDNRIIGSPGNTIYKVARGQGKTFIQDRSTNKYLTRLETLNGEKLEISLPNLPAATPVILADGVSIEWVFPQGHKVTQYVTEKHLKEIVFQKKNVPILFQYKPTGLNVVQKQYTLEFYSQNTGKLIYKTERPFYYENYQMIYIDVEIQKVNSNWHITYPNYNKDRTIDPTVVFGEIGGGAIGGTHKDTRIAPANIDRSDASTNVLNCRNGVTEVLLRFDVSSIPANATVTSGILTLTTDLIAGGNFTYTIQRLVTNWGVTNIDEGVTADPAANGQATWRRCYDFNGAGGDVVWAAGNFSAADHGAALVAVLIPVGAAAGTAFNWDITQGVILDVANDATNYGYHMESDNAAAQQFRSQENANVGDRPYLTVDYTLPVKQNLSSKISIPVGIGIY